MSIGFRIHLCTQGGTQRHVKPPRGEYSSPKDRRMFPTRGGFLPSALRRSDSRTLLFFIKICVLSSRPVENDRWNERRILMRGLIIVGAGLASTGNSTLCEILTLKYKNRGIRVKILPNPFQHVPLPILVPKDEKVRLRATSVICHYWEDILAPYLEETVRPALLQGGLVVIPGLGLKALTLATAYAHDDADMQCAIHAHHEVYVPRYVKDSGFPLPWYLMPTTSDVIRVMQYMTDNHPELVQNCSPKVIGDYIRHQYTIGTCYFDGTGQNPPILLNAAQTVEIMAVEAETRIDATIARHAPNLLVA